MAREEAAVKRVFDAIERGARPSGDDIKLAGACPSCGGFGYYYLNEQTERKTTCRQCRGTGTTKPTD
jgi:DnaJ-class molecular chaperone